LVATNRGGRTNENFCSSSPKSSNHVWAFLVFIADGRIVFITFIRLGNGIIYGSGRLDIIAEGVMTSMGRALAAALAGVLVVLFVASPKPQFWAFVVAALYVIRPPVHSHWVVTPTARDRSWQIVDVQWPAIACILAAFITARLRPKT
jgi:hypothetical protein